MPTDHVQLAQLWKTEGAWTYHNMTGLGDETAQRMYRKLSGRQHFSPWNPSLTPRKAVNTFRVGIGPPYSQAHEMWHQVYKPANIGPNLRMLAYDGDTFVAWLGTNRLKDARAFSAGDKQRLKRAQGRLLNLLIAEHRMGDELPERGANAMFDGAGRLQYLCGAAESWLTPDRRSTLSTLARGLDAGRPDPESFLLGNAMVRIVRLSGTGPSMYLFVLSLAQSVRRSPLADLTPKQREVAELAVAGAQISDIARMSGCGQETVRSHLKAVYRKLQVSSRVELAELLSEFLWK